MSWLGSLSIYFALYVAIVGTALAGIAGVTKSRRFLHASRFATYAIFGAVTIASGVLVHAFLTHDFSLQYVAGFSDRTMPTYYLVGAFWGGQAGSWLFWIWMASLFTALCVFINRDRYKEFMPWVMSVSMAVLSGLLIILVFASDPFEGYQLIDDPTTGEGLNPLLQTPKMVAHPPFLLGGMASMIVPFAFAMAALLSGNFGNTWVEAARKWVLVPWLLLTIGNILGGMWAYEELGWGGYWAWDPVENASLLPWLFATALIHSLMIQERRGMLKRWNIGLMIAAFLMTIFGTYITRSGLIESIHSFAQSDVGDYYLVLLIVVGIVSVGLFIWRWADLEGEQRLDSVVSRESAFILNNWIFLSMAVIVLFGTLWPRIRKWFTGQEVAMGPPWFNHWMVPIGLLLLLLMGVGTIIAWRKANWNNFKRNFVVPTVSSVVLTPVALATYWSVRGADLGVDPTVATFDYGIEILGVPLEVSINHAIMASGAVWLCLFVAATIVQEFYRGMAARRRGHDESWTRSFIELCMKQKRRYGGYIVHMGVVLAFLAFAGNALKIEKDVSLEQGQSVTVADYTLTYQNLAPEEHREQTLYVATMPVQRGGEPLVNPAERVRYFVDSLIEPIRGHEAEPLRQHQAHPGKAIFHATEEMPISEIDIRSTPLEDLYIALVDFDPQTRTATFKVFVSPFTWFFWFGGVIMVLGTLICLWPTRESLERLRPGSGGWGRAAVFGGLVALSLSPVVIWTAESHSGYGSAERYELIVDAGDGHPNALPDLEQPPDDPEPDEQDEGGPS